jgi:hypothetical protein
MVEISGIGLQTFDFSMSSAELPMETTSNDTVLLDQYGANKRVRTDVPFTFTRQPKTLSHETVMPIEERAHATSESKDVTE